MIPPWEEEQLCSQLDVPGSLEKTMLFKSEEKSLKDSGPRPSMKGLGLERAVGGGQ